MTKKDYVLIAEVVTRFHETSFDGKTRISDGHAENLADMFALALKETNPLFDTTRFMTACGF